MKKKLTIIYDDKRLEFGIPESEAELEEMFKGRYQAYHKKGHLERNESEIDFDKHDNKGSCTYFIAKYQNRIIGSMRFIKEEYLPTETDYYKFEEPPEIKVLPRDKRVEVGRLVSVNDGGLPRHLILMGLFRIGLAYAKENNILGGYGTLKDYVKNKLDFISFPIKEISEYKQVYNSKLSGDPLTGFFAVGHTYPIYFLEADVNKYLDKLFNFSFKKRGKDVFTLRKFRLKTFFIFSKIFVKLC